ncbi:hypothetical protein KR093_008206, partial [Drosophila rubida]
STMFYHRLLLLALTLKVATPSEHYHRYMLSDYRPQHTKKLYKDYRPVPRPRDDQDQVNDMRNQPLDQPMVALSGSKKKMPLHKLVVRGFEADKLSQFAWPVIVGAAIAIITLENNQKKLIYKTSTEEVLELDPGNIQTYDKLTLQFLKNSEFYMNTTMRLCQNILRPKDSVSLMSFSRTRQTFRSRKSVVLSQSECREKLNDLAGKIVTDEVICVRNPKRIQKCQSLLGLPLIFEDELCGLQFIGHNCPNYSGVDLYARVLDRNRFAGETLLQMAAKIENAMP